ncbi:DNA gyrase subunit A [Candidatus Woesearchaeota archaeon CG10_big_fil_rev_8_21_14_0_10_37_12]|nr:MAG: DNA gyrase subunit A [Candidatus Woesearchaeota archaeon CG10_big_fil_rev_8_21_14_0_10_37_12]
MSETESAQTEQKIVPRIIDKEMKQSYLGYSMSVIVGRALPDVRDGLKPVHRRVLFGMYEMGLMHNKPFKKSARIVGDVMGKYHPHGDVAIYDTMVRLAQDFSLRYPLVDGQGNFGSVDGDNPAAMRYTEARMKKLAEELLQDIDKETVNFVPNYDGSLKQPAVLPSKIPNLLINGSSGIAVGMATNIPPHNLNEVADGVVAMIDNPEVTVSELMQKIPAPDFPTGGIIIGTSGIRSAYASGKGKLVVRARAKVEDHKGRQRIVISEIPYMVNKAQLIEQIAELVNDKRIVGISDIRDESDRDGLRVVIELKQNANAELVLNQLFAHSRLQESFGMNMLALVDNQPKVISLRDALGEFIKHRQIVVRKRTSFDLQQAKDRAHILEGLIVALNDIDEIVKLIKQSSSAQVAKDSLMQEYALSEKQAQAILDMTLRRLTSLEQENIRNEHSGLLKKIEELEAILASEQKILAIIKSELLELKDKYGDARRTQIIEGDFESTDDESLIKQEDVVVTITHAGYVKRIPVDTYKQQKRGGRGITAAETNEGDFLETVFVANTHDFLLCFTNLGKVHWLKVHQLPEAGRYAKGTAIVNALQLMQGEKVSTFIPVKEFAENQFLFMVTTNGTVKKTPLVEFSNPRRGGILAVNLVEGDELQSVMLTDGIRKIIIATEQGMAVKFDELGVRSMGRTATGVIGIRLRDDKVVGATIAEDDKILVTVTEYGFGKRTEISEYRLTARGGVGVINIKITNKNGRVVAIKSVSDTDELMLISQKGILIRTPAKGISITGRNTQGVRVMRLGEGDKLMNVAKIAYEDESTDSNE